MTEVVAQFGENGRLSGILTSPDGASNGVACVLVTAGLVAKAGPYRLYTQIARRLARSGVTTLRFDLGGVGDSTAVQGGALRERTELEVRSAIDFAIKACGDEVPRSVVLAGLCSGAEDSFRHADIDPRVGGVLLIDPFAWKTKGWEWRHMRYRATRRLLRAAKRFVPLQQASRAVLAGGGSVVKYKYIEPPAASRILADLIRRKVPAHFIYTGGALRSFNHRGQLQKMFPGLAFGDLVTIDHLPSIDHTQMLQEDRDLLLERIERWFARVSAR